jgi:hypothetical protein
VDFEPGGWRFKSYRDAILILAVWPQVGVCAPLHEERIPVHGGEG